MILAALAALALSAPPPPPAPPAPPAPPSVSWGDDGQTHEIPAQLEWTVQPTEDENAQPGSVDFQIGYRSPHSTWMNGHTVQVSTLGGLTADQLASAGQPVAFVLNHDAGEFDCKGVAGQGRGTGTCTYQAHADFQAGLERRGVKGSLEPWTQFQLTISDIGYAYLDELKHEGYATPDVTDLVHAGTHGAGMKTLLAFDASGYRFGSVAELVRVRDHGVSPKYIDAVKGYGLSRVPAEDLVRMRDHGVSATYLQGLTEAGYNGLSAQAMIGMRDHGVSTGYINEVRSLGYNNLTPEDLTRLRDHGVSASFIGRANADGEHHTADELIRLREGGVR
jgi:hypothetical protein